MDDDDLVECAVQYISALLLRKLVAQSTVIKMYLVFALIL